MDKAFLLDNETAELLYYQYAEKMPIIDYHCHIDPAEIYNDKRFADLAEVWLGGDHYKWRLMRANGLSERCVTGEASGYEKFRAFAEVLPRAIGNPVYHWAHLELKRFFGCDTPLNPDTAEKIWDFCNDKIRNDPALSVRGIVKSANVRAIFTTDDPADTLIWHDKLASDKSFDTIVLPAWRPDAVLNINSSAFAQYIRKLEAAAGLEIGNYDGLKAALKNRMEYFAKHGCRACDHGIGQVEYMPATESDINRIFEKALRGEELTAGEISCYRYAVLTFCAKEYARLNWVMEIHFGVKRDVNSNMFKKLGPDTGYDCVDPVSGMTGLARFFDTLNREGSLPKTLVFSANPAENLVLNTLVNCFQQEGIRGKVQQGSAWWFNDTQSGMEQQLKTFAEQGVLANFIGMLTDSRSFLSYTRHEYFRRILCNILGEWVESGKYPADLCTLGGLVQDICYNNTADFFNLE